MNQAIKKHGPLAAVGAIAMFALARSPSTPSSPVTTATITTGAGSAVPAHTSQAGAVTRLVSCGEMRSPSGARLDAKATDEHGSIALGLHAKGGCTVLFASPWTARPLCMVVGGRIAKLTATDLVIEGAADHVTYDCGAAK